MNIVFNKCTFSYLSTQGKMQMEIKKIEMRSRSKEKKRIKLNLTFFFFCFFKLIIFILKNKEYKPM